MGAIRSFVDSIEAKGLDLHSFILTRGSDLLAEGYWHPYSADRPHVLYSLSKSFTSTAVGLAVSEGRFSLDDLVVDFFPEDLPDEVSPNLARMKVRHLLSMSVGHAEEAFEARENDNWAKAFLAHPVPYEPGTRFLYNSLATYMCSAIVQRTTGTRLLDYLKPRLFEPLGIHEATWEQDPLGIDVGGWGLSLTTRSISKFGRLYLQDGLWEDKRILPEGWVAEATRAHVSNGDDPNSEWAQGYGFQFWRCRHNAYRGDGAFGQYCVVMPEQNAVLAMTGSVDDMQAVLASVWDHLLPDLWTMQPEDPGRLVLSGPLGVTEPVSAFSGTYHASTGQQACFEFAAIGATIRYLDQTLTIPSEGWSIQPNVFDGEVGVRGGWSAPNGYEFKVVDLHAPLRFAFVCRFSDDRVEIRGKRDGVFQPSVGLDFEGMR